MKLRAYYWMADEDAETGLGVIAENIKEAKMLASSYWASDVGFDDPDWFILQRCTWKKDVKTEGMDKGVVDDWILGLKIGLYGWVLAECPICQHEDTLYYDEERKKVGCDNCLYPND